MIVATAGHVDHGKTLLIRTLTGIDTDRLPEERARGMTIDLGFAYLPLAGARADDAAQIIGFIDVPGHERFVRNMLAGVAGIDFALIVIAADDGPMPQTREHLAILHLLGITRGVVALTKIDRVAPARVTAVQAEIAALLATTALAGIPIVPTAAPTGAGIEDLRALLQAAQRASVQRDTQGHFRLAIDRSFVREGAGRVVTGTVYSGAMAVGDRLLIAPAGIEVRVRSIHAQNQIASHARAGQRCGINLAGADLRRYEIHRGDWLVAPALAASATRLGVQLTLTPGDAQALRDRTPVHVHLGAADVGGRVTLLRDRALTPGDTCYATLTLDAPVIAVRGDRCVLRDQSATRTLGGGRILEPLPFPRALTRTRRLTLLAAMEAAQPAEALRALLAQLPEGVDNTWFARSWNLTESEALAIRADLDVATVTLPKGETILLAAARWRAILMAINEAVARHHAAEPAHTGLPETQLAKRVDGATSGRLLRAACDALVREGSLRRRAGQLCLPDHEAVLSAGEQALLARIATELQRHGLQAPALHDMLEPLKLKAEILRPFVERMAQLGRLHQVSKYRFYLPAALHQLALLAEQLAASGSEGLFTAAEYRDRSGIGRNVTIEVLEYFDRIGLTQRHGQTRRLRRAVTEVLGAAP